MRNISATISVLLAHEVDVSIFRNQGRIAGLIYLLLVLIAPIRLVFIPGKLFVSGNAEATAVNIIANEKLFRFGIVSDLITGTIMVFLMLALYRLFSHANKEQAVLMVILGGPVVASIYFFNVLNDAATLALIRSDHFLNVFTPPQLHAAAYFFLRLHGYEETAAELVWGRWLLPLAILIYQSRLVPRFFAIWLTANGFAYIVSCFVGFVAPQYDDKISIISSPLMLGEIAFMLWLLVRGVRLPSTASLVS